jgi:hypothetical protein
MPMAEGPHLSLLLEAITIEGRGHRALLIPRDAQSAPASYARAHTRTPSQP